MVGKYYRVALLSFLFILPNFLAFGQKDFTEKNLLENTPSKSGIPSDFILDSSGNKVFGRVIRSFDFSDYEVIEFEKDGKITTYAPDQIQGFGLDNGRFFLSKLLPDSDDFQFAQILFSGKYQLLERKNKFFVDSGLEIIELKIIPRENYTGKKKFVKLYISTLKFLMTGRCGLELAPKIERADLEEQDLIQIFIEFHECEDYPYVVHVDKIPLVKVSPTIGIGGGMVSPKALEAIEGRAVDIQSPYFVQAMIGGQLHDFRKAPRLSFDFKVGYRLMSSSWLVSQISGSYLYIGSQDIRQGSLLIPLSLNYTFYKKEAMDLYLGLGGGFVFSKLKNEEGLVDLTNLTIKETVLTYEDLVDVRPKLFSPAIKLGSNIYSGSNKSIYTEVLAEYAKAMYISYLPNYHGKEYNSFSVSLSLGIKF
ncbi:hypothetical protein FHS59_000271 [Algoriphagus iocasae]|uniref:Outer membrane protein beta-barrel domain-containing protein n=1 Tax=Algoriphagus iocasae TaxID=1836499 RepID=A0A841MK81_9BACT|nr:hypothetical protein [Algoriphagus iocasae]MBB6324656.1 hypothetical protein [Algoriphagus iocasae]